MLSPPLPVHCPTTLFVPGSTRVIGNPKTVAHTDPPLHSLDRFAAAAKGAGWETHELACGHDMMLAAPDETAALLERIATS